MRDSGTGEHARQVTQGTRNPGTTPLVFHRQMNREQQVSPFSVTYEECDKYLYACVTGAADTVATSLSYWSAIAEECRRRGYSRLLVVENLRTRAPIADVYRVGARLPEIVRGLVVAFVDDAADQYSENVFGETVAVNRGARGKVFRDTEAAARWLNDL